MENLKERYKAFSEELLHEYRYIHSKDSKRFLTDVLAIAKHDYTICVEKGTELYRARVNDELRAGREIEPKKVPRDCSEMTPVPNVVSGGRVNAQNVCVLYTSDKVGIALAEVRPGPKYPVSVGTFITKRKLKLVDLSYEMNWYNHLFDVPKYEDFWYDLSYEFSRPTVSGAEHRYYVRTQVISEFFKANGYDGIRYRSQFYSHVGNVKTEEISGYNYVFFDLASAECSHVDVYEVLEQHTVFKKSE